MKTNLLKLTPKDFCKAAGACSSGRDFAITQPTMADVWDNCQRVDWLCWILEKLDAPNEEKKAREFMCWCARNTPLADGRTTWWLLTDERSRAAVNVALRFARDEANQTELSAAESAAWSAAESAAESAAWSAAESAAWSAAESAAWSTARSAARSAAWSAAKLAARSAAKPAAKSAAWSAAESAQAREFKRVFANPFKEAHT